MAAQTGLLETERDTRRIQVSLLSLARDVVRQADCLRPDLDAENDQILTELTQFDTAACIP